MAIIGNFHKGPGTGFSGAITTLTLNVRGAEIRPVLKADERAPDFKVFCGQTELGAAWQRTSRDQRQYLSVKLDDPSFPSPIYAHLVEVEGRFALIWARGKTGD